MNRIQKRLAAREEKRRQTVRMTPEDRHALIERAQNEAWKCIFPLFLLYLVDHFHCKDKGLAKFANWFSEIDAWVGGDEKRLYQLLDEVTERSGANIEIFID